MPTFILGHCIGSLYVLVLMILNKNLKISGVILTSPFLMPKTWKNLSFLKKFIFKNFLGVYLKPLIISSLLNPTEITSNNFVI